MKQRFDTVDFYTGLVALDVGRCDDVAVQLETHHNNLVYQQNISEGVFVILKSSDLCFEIKTT